MSSRGLLLLAERFGGGYNAVKRTGIVICFWEDDGQDTDDAEIIRGGPNHDYSLKEARENFVKYHTMYRPTDIEHFERKESQMDFKRQLYQMYSKAMKSGNISDWKEAISVHEKYYDDDEC